MVEADPRPQGSEREHSLPSPHTSLHTEVGRFHHSCTAFADRQSTEDRMHVPFSTSDLHKWKIQNPKFSEKPCVFIAIYDSVMVTHKPTWDDCQQVLQAVFKSRGMNR